MQARLNALGKESAKPLALIYIAGAGLKHGKPLMAAGEIDGPAITDEGVGDPEAEPAQH